MNLVSRRFVVSALALSLAMGCGEKKKDIGNNPKTPATKTATSRPAAATPSKATPPEPAKPEVRVAELSGKVEVLKNANNAGSAWASLASGESFDVADAPMFRVGPDAKLVISLPDDSKLTADPQTMFFFAENERREIALVSGALDIQMKDKSTDRAGMQIRTTAGLVRGPQAAFTVGVNPLGDTMLFVERGVVYVGDEKVDLSTQAAQAQEAIDAAAKGQEPPKIEKTPSAYTKVDPGKLALLAFGSSVPQVTQPTTPPTAPPSAEPVSAPVAKPAPPKPVPAPTPAPTVALPDPSAAAVHTFAADAAWEAKFAKSLTDWVKATEENNKKVEENLAKTESFKEQNLKQIEALKAARAAKDQATVTKIQSEITRSSRLLLALKRQAHLLTLESYIKTNAIDSVSLTAKEGSDIKKALTTNEAKLTELKAKVAELRQKTASLRPRTRVPANLNNPGARALPPGLKLPAGSPNVIQPPGDTVAPGMSPTPQ